MLQAQNNPAPFASLTGEERWKSYLDHTFTAPLPYLREAVAAGFDQINNSPPEWGQGAAGYGRRFASEFGELVIYSTIREGGDAILGLDPRYNHCACSGFFARTGHAIKWTFVTRNASGSTRFDLPTLAGAYGSSMLEIYWYPARYNPLSDGVRIGTQQVGYIIGANILREFTPEIKRILHWKR